ncbi:MAG: hypothetical protein FWG38_09280 [Defluviitaleaceae bacterium]|nr:hypothetical protein [Defluviitaleaceae bacterium]
MEADQNTKMKTKTNAKMDEKYKAIITAKEAELAKDRKLFDRLGHGKVFSVLVLITATVFLFASGFAWQFILLIAIVFAQTAVLWVRHHKLDNKIRYTKGIIAICQNHIARISGEWTTFADTGKEFIDPAHPYACDLDMVGPKSFFQYLNTTHTWHGRQAFAQDLLRPNYTLEQITARQAAILELSAGINFANDIQYHLSQIGASPLDIELTAELADPAPLKLRVPKILITLMPVATVALLAGGAIFQIMPLLVAGIVLAALQAAMAFWEKTAVYKYLGLMNRLPYKLGKYVAAIDMLTARGFSSAKLNTLKSRLLVASEAVKALESIGNKLSVRSNPLVFVAFNVLLLWDLHCALLLERWKAKYAHQAAEWFDAIGEFESLLAFSHLPNVCAGVCLPQLEESGKRLDATALGHPLILGSRRVCNDVDFDNNIFIISGSNMSGKTTFMRTVGVNLVLARAGSFVCATSMACARFNLVTSMRIADDLNEGVSTFYAELKRVKLVLDTAAADPHLMFLIDEIFKGTNSVDRLAGADAVITKLEKLGAAGMVSTHDLELCRLAGVNTRMANYNFSERYADGKIIFDYTLRKGPSQTTNARFLMEMVGI